MAELWLRLLEGLLKERQGAEFGDWGEVALRLGVPDPESWFSGVHHNVGATLRSAHDFCMLGDLCQGLAAKICRAARIRSFEDQWVLNIKCLDATKPTAPEHCLTVVLTRLPPTAPPLYVVLPGCAPFRGSREHG